MHRQAEDGQGPQVDHRPPGEGPRRGHRQGQGQVHRGVRRRHGDIRVVIVPVSVMIANGKYKLLPFVYELVCGYNSLRGVEKELGYDKINLSSRPIWISYVSPYGFS